MSDQDEKQEALDEDSLVSVREVQDESEAILLCDFLKSQGIESAVVAAQMPWLGTLETLHRGYWGRVEVLGKDADRARALIEEYLSGTPEKGPGEEKI